jgi:hypothetical protein
MSKKQKLTWTRKVLVLTDKVGQCQWIEVVKGEDKLKILQKAVNGSITGVHYGAGWSCYGNDEGLVRNMNQNAPAAFLITHLNDEDFLRLIYGPTAFVFENTRAGHTAIEKAEAWLGRFRDDPDFDGIM